MGVTPIETIKAAVVQGIKKGSVLDYARIYVQKEDPILWLLENDHEHPAYAYVLDAITSALDEMSEDDRYAFTVETADRGLLPKKLFKLIGELFPSGWPYVAMLPIGAKTLLALNPYALDRDLAYLIRTSDRAVVYAAATNILNQKADGWYISPTTIEILKENRSSVMSRWKDRPEILEVLNKLYATIVDY